MLGLAAFALTRRFAFPFPEAAAGDTFFLAFLLMSWLLIFRLTDDDLEHKADVQDEGAFIVTLITIAAIVYAMIAIFTTLNEKHLYSPLSIWLTLAGAPLGWFMLHTVTAFHYANVYYRDDDQDGYVPPLKFPECHQPGPWDFIYFSIVVGMTAQVSDALVQTTEMRRMVMLHSVVSFFFNTVLIAMAVNAAVTMAA